MKEELKKLLPTKYDLYCIFLFGIIGVFCSGLELWKLVIIAIISAIFNCLGKIEERYKIIKFLKEEGDKIMPAECCKETWNKISEDEPVFIIRGQDLLATEAIKTWIMEALKKGVNSDKINRAVNHLKDIQEFQNNNPERCKLPD